MLKSNSVLKGNLGIMKRSSSGKLAFAALLLSLTLLLTGCFSSPIEATWSLNSIGGSGDTSSELSSILGILKRDHEVTMTFKNGNVTLGASGVEPQKDVELQKFVESLKFTYTLSGNKMTLTIDSLSTVCTWAVSGNTLTIDYSGSHLVFSKKN